MRTFALKTLTAGILAMAAIPATAAQIVETFTIPVSGEPDQHFLSTPFDLFDRSLGTLLGVSESVSGSLTWDPGDGGEQLFLRWRKRARASFSLVRTRAVLKSLTSA
jgi:hypothetical protein